MAFFDGYLTRIGTAIAGVIPGIQTLLLRKSDGEAIMLAGNANGAALVEIDPLTALPLPTGAATNAQLATLFAKLEPPTIATAITPADATDLTALASIGITIGVGGTLVARFVGAPSTSVTMTVQAGQFIYGQFSRVMAATTATGIVGWAP